MNRFSAYKRAWLIVVVFSIFIYSCASRHEPGYQVDPYADLRVKLQALLEQREFLKIEYRACKEMEKNLVALLDDLGNELYNMAKEDLREAYRDAMLGMFYDTSPMLVSMGNPKGLAVDWWNYPKCYRIKLRIAREDRQRFMGPLCAEKLKEKFDQLIQREYDIRDKADNTFFNEQRIKGIIRREHSESMNAKTLPTILRYELYEQEELLSHRPRIIREWWNYQKEFGFDDYEPPK
jgi:hypothetical protein